MSDDPLDTAPVPSDARRAYSHSPAPSSAASNTASTSRPRRERATVDYSIKLSLAALGSPGVSRLSAADKGKGRASSMARDVLKRAGPGKKKGKLVRRVPVVRPKSAVPRVPPDDRCSFCDSVENP